MSCALAAGEPIPMAASAMAATKNIVTITGFPDIMYFLLFSIVAALQAAIPIFTLASAGLDLYKKY
jgi:hypothetical protein